MYTSCSTLLNFEPKTTWQAVGEVLDFLFFSDFLVFFGYSLVLNVLIEDWEGNRGLGGGSGGGDGDMKH